MHLGITTINHLRWLQQRQVLQPQAGCLSFAVAEPPWLNDLLGGAITVLMMLTGFSIHHLSIGAAINKRTKSSASACSRCLR